MLKSFGKEMTIMDIISILFEYVLGTLYTACKIYSIVERVSKTLYKKG